VNGDRLVRWTAVAAVLAVAGVAAWISYRHAVDVVTVHGEPGAVGRWYPVVIDGLIVAASMVLLDASRHREDAPRLAWAMLAAGIGATLAVNVLAGVPSGWLAALIASWPALAFVGCYELLMLLVRAAARRAGKTPAGAPEAVPEPVAAEVATTVREAAKAAYIASVRGGNPLAERALADRFGIGRTEARKIRAEVVTAANGHEHPEIPEDAINRPAS
jgi:hypothetical protein